MEGHPLQVRHKQDWGRGFILLLPQTAALPESDAGSGVIKPALSFVIQNRQPRAPCGARCIGHAVRTWSAVCSEAPHSQFGEGARPHLCMDEWNRPFVHGRMEAQLAGCLRVQVGGPLEWDAGIQ